MSTEGHAAAQARSGDDVSKVTLKDGRRYAYLEKGANCSRSENSLLVLHGLGSSRLANMPGVSDELLEEFHVRLVAIDRAGYGRSDQALGMTLQSAAYDLAEIADALKLGPKFWLLGYSGGAAYCWAATRYIPERLAGVAMWAPVGNFWWKAIPSDERRVMMSSMTADSRIVLYFGGRLPPALVRFFVRRVIVLSAGEQWLNRCRGKLSLPDRQHLAVAANGEKLRDDNLESLGAGAQGQGMAKDLELFNKPWGFELHEVADHFPGPVHIWQGTDDILVPAGLQRIIQKELPGVVTLHELTGEGHLSWFCHNEDNHRKVLETLFRSA